MADRAAASAAQPEGQKLRTVSDYLAKIRQRGAKWEKDELLNVVYWFRQFAGVFIGLAVGFTRFTGISGIVMFFLTSVSLTLAFVKNVLGVDEDEHGGGWDFIFEGLMGSFASFMITWILTYTHVQNMQEALQQ